MTTRPVAPAVPNRLGAASAHQGKDFTEGLHMMTTNLHRVRWAVRATLTLGVAASVAANILHARHNPISQAIAAWPPLALLVTVELISRVPVSNRWLSAVRLAATAAISGIAAWVSYWHMASVVARFGETGAAPYLMPFSVDGLIVVASICLVELGARIRATTGQPHGQDAEQSTAVVAERQPTTTNPTATVPAHLIPAARFAVTNHHATTGRPITVDELAARMSLPDDTARQLLALLDVPESTTPLRVNGAAVDSAALIGGAR